MVIFLLDSNADANARDRFDGTALHDSIRHRAPEAVNSALKKAGCQLLGMDTAIALCEASASGDLAAIRTLVENGVQPNLGDYDGKPLRVSFFVVCISSATASWLIVAGE